MTGKPRIKTERAIHRDTFEIYWGLGQGRSLVKLAEKTKLSLSRLRNFSASFQWQNRIYKRECDVYKEVERKIVSNFAAERVKLLCLVDKSLEGYRDALKNGTVKFETPKDLDTLARLKLALLGDDGSRPDTGLPLDARTVLFDRVLVLAERMQGLSSPPAAPGTAVASLPPAGKESEGGPCPPKEDN